MRDSRVEWREMEAEGKETGGKEEERGRERGGGKERERKRQDSLMEKHICHQD